jgi:hypothetical protein
LASVCSTGTPASLLLVAVIVPLETVGCSCAAAEKFLM